MSAPGLRFSGCQMQERVGRLKDPMIYQLERAAPTPQEGIMVTLQWVGISEGDRPHSRSDQCIRTGSQDIKKKQTCHEE